MLSPLHINNLYPTEREYKIFMEKTKLDKLQLKYWFKNARKRILKPRRKNKDLRSSDRVSGSSLYMNVDNNQPKKRRDILDAAVGLIALNLDFGGDPAITPILVQLGDPGSAQTSIHPNQPKRRDVFDAAVGLIALNSDLGGVPPITHVPVQLGDQASPQTSIQIGEGGLEPNKNTTTSSTGGLVKLKRGRPMKTARVDTSPQYLGLC